MDKGNDKIGIVILNYNTWMESIQCIDSITRNMQNNYHIFLVDNNSTDNSWEKICEYSKEKDYITLIKAESNRGYSAGNNLGIKQAIVEGCDVIFVINSDVELLNNALDKMKKVLLSNANCMIIGPSILDNKRQEIQLARKKLTWKSFICERHPLCYIPYLKKMAKREYEIPLKGNYIFNGMVLGCCFGIRSKDIEEIQYLDENVFLYYEEDILAYKMDKLNKKAIVDCEAKVWHKIGTSTKKEGRAFVRFHSWTSAFYVLKRYGDIKTWQQYIVVISNLSVWIVKSVISREYRAYLKEFIEKNISILRNIK